MGSKEMKQKKSVECFVRKFNMWVALIDNDPSVLAMSESGAWLRAMIVMNYKDLLGKYKENVKDLKKFGWKVRKAKITII